MLLSCNSQFRVTQRGILTFRLLHRQTNFASVVWVLGTSMELVSHCLPGFNLNSSPVSVSQDSLYCNQQFFQMCGLVCGCFKIHYLCIQGIQGSRAGHCYKAVIFIYCVCSNLSLTSFIAPYQFPVTCTQHDCSTNHINISTRFSNTGQD